MLSISFVFQCAVEFQHFDLIMHPVFRKLIDVKWSKFAKKRCLLQVAQQFLFVILWTIVGVTLPRDYKYYKPISDRWWNITLESIVLIWTAYYVTVVRSTQIISIDFLNTASSLV